MYIYVVPLFIKALLLGLPRTFRALEKMHLQDIKQSLS